MMPGLESGGSSNGETSPALPKEVLSLILPLSMTITSCPFFMSIYAQDSPTIPPPITMALLDIFYPLKISLIL